MDTIAGSPFLWLHFDEAGVLRDSTAATRLAEKLANEKVRQLVVLSHGWNNDENDARELYSGLWSNALRELPGGSKAEEFVVAGVLWPAKKYDADYDGAAATDVRPQGGGTKSVDDFAGGVVDIDPVDFREKFALLDGFIDDQAAGEIRDAALSLEATGDDQSAFDFFDIAKQHFGLNKPTGDDELLADFENLAETETPAGANLAITKLANPPAFETPAGTGGAKGLGSIVSGTFQGTRSGILRALNMLTYYTMKKRAGVVGQSLGRLLGSLHPPRPIQLHMAGHSFGARLVTSAASTLQPTHDLEFKSLTLLQGAYSHNALGGGGPFANVIGKPTGAIVYTHTHNDLACTIAYPLASRLSGDTTKSLGGADDPFGAMGANGPQGLAGTLVRADPAALNFHPGKINLVLADTFVVAANGVDAHNNVATPACGKVLARAMTA